MVAIWVWLVMVVWLVLSLPVALLVGGFCALRDRQVPEVPR